MKFNIRKILCPQIYGYLQYIYIYIYIYIYCLYHNGYEAHNQQQLL